MNQHLDRLEGVAPFLRPSVMGLINNCDQKLKRKLMIVSGWRSVQEQMLNYQKGRTLNRETGEWDVTDLALVVTRSKPGSTPHNVIARNGERASVAVDLIPLLDNGEADWNVGEDFWDHLYELAWKVGLDPLGDPVGGYLKMDKGHFEEPAFRLKLDGLGLLLPVSGLVTT
jgi:hypothetical protein